MQIPTITLRRIQLGLGLGLLRLYLTSPNISGISNGGTHLYKLYGYGLCKRTPSKKNSIISIRFTTSILGRKFWWKIWKGVQIENWTNGFGKWWFGTGKQVTPFESDFLACILYPCEKLWGVVTWYTKIKMLHPRKKWLKKNRWSWRLVPPCLGGSWYLVKVWLITCNLLVLYFGELKPSNRRPFPFKTRVIWLPGINQPLYELVYKSPNWGSDPHLRTS